MKQLDEDWLESEIDFCEKRIKAIDDEKRDLLGVNARQKEKIKIELQTLLRVKNQLR